jgi:hypothetical protein
VPCVCDRMTFSGPPGQNAMRQPSADTPAHPASAQLELWGKLTIVGSQKATSKKTLRVG